MLPTDQQPSLAQGILGHREAGRRGRRKGHRGEGERGLPSAPSALLEPRAIPTLPGAGAERHPTASPILPKEVTDYSRGTHMKPKFRRGRQAINSKSAVSYTPGIGGDPAQLAQCISSNIQKITQCSAEIQRTLYQLGTPPDSPELRQQLQQKQQYTNQLAKETDKYMKEFGTLPTTPSEQRQRKIQKDRLVAEFTTALTNFQKVQRQAAEREKGFVARVRASSRVSGGFPEDTSKERNLVSWESQTQPQVQVQDDEITEDDLRLIHERESSIRQLEADIMDINEIFKHLGTMIHEQGGDSIEANVESAEVHVQQANQQLSRVVNYQRKSRKTLCIIIFVLVIGAVIVGIIIWKLNP
ncbi:LOW QUALITY PROTEIN: syntaxin-7-like [Erethizon dorsatum]